MMKPVQLLLIGVNGQVGYELRRTLAPFARVIGVDYPQINLTDPSSIRSWVDQTRPEVIVNAAAYTAVDKAEADAEAATQINGVAPGILAQEAAKSGALLVHYSTDYVFDGTKQTPYVEEDAPSPLSAYGRTKLQGDQAVMQSGAAHLIFRLCWVYGGRGQNFMLTMMRLAREREKLRVVCDQTGAPTWSRMIAEATALAVKQTVAAEDRNAFNGLYHLCADGQASWHEFAGKIISLMPPEGRLCREVEAITTDQYPTAARRPARSHMCCDKLERVFGLRLPAWDESLECVMKGS